MRTALFDAPQPKKEREVRSSDEGADLVHLLDGGPLAEVVEDEDPLVPFRGLLQGQRQAGGATGGESQRETLRNMTPKVENEKAKKKL